MNRPLSITLIAILFLCLGLRAVFEIIQRATQGVLHFNFGFFMIPIAIGLLRGKDSSRVWAKIWCGIWLLPAILVSAAYPFYGRSWNVTDPYGLISEVGLDAAIVIGLLLILATSLVIWRCLSTERAREFFAN